MGISIGNLRPSIAIVYNDQLYIVVECEHAKLGRGSAFCRARIKNLKNAQVLDVTLRDSDKIEEAFIEQRTLQYLYREGNIFHFLDLDTYEDLVLDKERIGENAKWLKDNLNVAGLFYSHELINLELPPTLNLKVIETEPGFKGNTVKLVTKPAKLETGVVIQVPTFINAGETIKVNTITKEYMGRV